MTIGLVSNVPYFHLRICFLALVLYIISASDGSKYKQDIQKINRQSEESLAEGKRPTAMKHEENKGDHSRISNSEEDVSVSENEKILALNWFLKNASGKQNEFQWIYQIVHKMKLRTKNLENSAEQKRRYSSRLAAVPSARIEATRKKREFNTNRNSDISDEHRKRKFESHDSLGVPKRIHLEKEVKFKRYAQNSDFKYNTILLGSIDKPINEEMEASKDLFCKKADSRFTYQKLKGDTLSRCTNNYEIAPADFVILDISKEVWHLSCLKINYKENKKIDSDVEDPGNSVVQCELSQIIGHVLSEKSRTMKEANADQFSLSLETLKQTVLEPRESLIESNKGTNKNGNMTNISRPEEYDTQVEKDTRKRDHRKNEHESDMLLRDLKKLNTIYGYAKNVKKSFNCWEDFTLAAEIFYFKRRAKDSEYASKLKKSNDLEDENEDEISYLKEITQRVKKDRKNNEEEEDLKLFQKAGFGELSFEILNDHRGIIKTSLKREQKQDPIEVHFQSLIRQTTGKNNPTSELQEFDNNQRNVSKTDIIGGSQSIPGADRIMIFQHRMGRRILQDSVKKNRNWYENPSKFYKRTKQFKRLGKSFERSQNKEEFKNIEDYEDQEKEDGFQDYNDKKTETEDYGLYLNTEDGDVRKRRVPVIQYFDYEGAANDEDEEMPISTKIQFKIKDTPREKSDMYPQKKNQQKDEEEKLDKDKKVTKNKTPREEFIGNINVPKISENKTLNETPYPKDVPFRGKIKHGKENQGKDKLSDQRPQRNPRIWFDQSSETLKLLKASNKANEDSRRLIFTEPLEYNLNVQGKLKPGALSDFLSNDLPLEERLFEQDNDLLSFENNEEDYEPQRNGEYRKLEDSVVSREKDLGAKYEELENTNASEGPIRERSRLRGDHRMNLDFQEASDMEKNQFDGDSEGSRRNWYQKERDSTGDSEAEKKSYKSEEGNQIPDEQNSQSEEDKFFGKQLQEKSSAFHITDDRKSGSSFLALKSTDDMFKGGIEQSNPSEKKTSNGLIPSQKTSEWKVVKAGDSSTYSVNDQINANKSSESRFDKPAIEADFIFKEEDVETPEEISCKKNKYCSQDTRSILNSDDLMHESFVESLDWMNDFGDDDDEKIRLGRGLKSLEKYKKILNDNTGFACSKKVDVSTEGSYFKKNSTVTNIITLPVDGHLHNLNIEQKFELAADHFDDADTYATESQLDYNIKNNIGTFLVHKKKPEIEQLRIRREAFGENDLVNGKSGHRLRNHLSRLKRQFNKFARASVRKYKNKNIRHKYNHDGNYNNDNERNRQWMKKYSPEVRRNKALKEALRSKLSRRQNPEKIGEQQFLQWMLSDETDSEALPHQVKQLNDIVKHTGIKEYEDESHKPLHNEVDKKWPRPKYAFQYRSSQLKHHKENKPAYKKSLLSSFESKDDMMHSVKKRNIRSEHRKAHHHKKHKKHRGKHRKGKKHKYKPAGRTSREYRKMEHRNRQFRRKRANMDYADWSHDSGYEKRSIFSPDASKAQIYGFSFEKDGRDSDGITQNVLTDHTFEKSRDFKRKNDQQSEKVSLGKELKNHMKELQNFENIIKNQNVNVKMPDKKKHPKNNYAVENTLNSSRSGITLSVAKKNKATDENEIGFLAMVLKFIGILQLSSDNTKCRFDQKNLIVEDEVRKIEEKTNVYPETTESTETKCFENSENISTTTCHSESNQNLQENNINKTGYLYDSNIQSGTTYKSEQTRRKI
ncbi:uncharacterized protein LOC117168377 isoform X2 [Belonocnema kinseyi]|uniref:uncharacterized protein LOC117168377 isoform X2 n=1 Tax=Belonocnema kinseyi TaxID=2817044 RepID=UPI00143D3849|nr:uncharacterized protein LOC117168377 isoform X2 [Belonocnema kinseyi]